MTAIVTAELLFKYSAPAASAGNTTAQASPDASLGGYISTTQWAGGTPNDLFNDITGAQNAAGQVDYRCVFLHNSNASNTLQAPALWISSEVAGGASISLAVDNSAASAIGAATAQADQVASTTTAPTAVGAFSAPTTFATGLALGDIPAGSCKAFWFKRTAANTAALSNDGVTIEVQGDTGSL